MRLPVDEKNLRIMQSNIGFCLIVADLTEQFTPLSIYKGCFTNVRAI